MSETFCVLPWMHIQTKPDGQMKPCCRFDIKHPDYKTQEGYKFDKFNVNGMSFTEAVNSDEWIKIRDAISAGERVPGCRKCYQEDYGDSIPQPKNIRRKHKSMRVKQNLEWNQDNQIEVVGKADGVKLRYLELAFGNHCNLKCRTCNGSLSTTWYDDDNTLAKYYKDRKYHKEAVNVESDWNIKDFEHVEEIKFTGGEPMLHPDFIKTIDLIISTGRQHLITLDIFTNASWIPREKILSRLMQFKQVTINLSVDGIGYVNDYIRFPSEWPTVDSSVREWLIAETKDPERLYVKWAPVISIMNVWSFHKMLEWWFALQKEIANKEWWDVLFRYHGSTFITMIINVAYDPAYIRPSLFPKKFLLNEKLNAHRDNLIQEMNNYEHEIDAGKKWNAELTLFGLYSKVLTALNEELDPAQLKLFVEYTADLDKIRSQDIRVNLPHLWKRIEGIVEYKGRIND